MQKTVDIRWKSLALSALLARKGNPGQLGLGSSASINTFNFAGTTVLQDGATYALIASAAADGNESDLGRYFSDSDLGHVFRNNSFSWTFDDEGNAPAFRVNGTLAPIPEPATILMFGAAMIGLSFSTRRRRVA